MEEYVKRFRDSLRRIAVRFAHHTRADSIDAVHVDEAFEALVRLGLKRQIWWKRSELKITVAAVLLAVAANCPDFTPLIVDDAQKQQALAIGAAIVCAGFGCVLYIWGWIQDKI